MAENGNYLKFFGIAKPLFINRELRGEDLDRFVDREQLLGYFNAALHGGSSCAIIGAQGTGKSSFLLKLMADIETTFYCDYLQFSFPPGDIEKSRLDFLKSILRSLLNLINRNDELLKLFEKNRIESELKRLEYSITYEEQSRTQKNLSGQADAEIKGALLKLMLPVDFAAKFDVSREAEKQAIETRNFPLHNDTTLHDTIALISGKLKEPVVLFIDELDKIGRFPLESPGWDQEVVKILELSREIMANEKLIMVFSLQEELYGKLVNAKQGEGDISILGLINYFKELSGFDIAFAKNAVTRSLKAAHYPGTLEDLFEKGVLEIALEVAKGNPRLFMTYLADLSYEAPFNNQHTFSLDFLKGYLVDLFKDRMDEKRWQALLKKAI
jgi:hypothetical protein